ncbi:hypothetical protein AgCh_036205 [Apium graveolens]
MAKTDMVVASAATLVAAQCVEAAEQLAAVIPVEKGMNRSGNGGVNRELLARGCELLKHNRKGDLHWKIASFYINRMGRVTLKMKSSNAAGTITKKKKNIVLEVIKDIPAWPVGRHLLEGGEHRRYFRLKTVSRGRVRVQESEGV